MNKKRKPTSAEIEILKVLWNHGPSSVRVVHDILSQSKEIFYTTTLKTMQVMLDKGFLSRDTSSRSHIYAPELDRSTVEKSIIEKMVDSVFGGSSAKLVISAIGHRQPNQEELEEIRKMIDKLDKNQDQ